MPTVPRPRRARSISPSLEIRRSLWQEDEGFEVVDHDRVTRANFSLPASKEPTQESPLLGRARLSTRFGVPLFHLDGRRDNNNTVAWWPYDVESALSLEISSYRTRTPKEQLWATRLYLNRRQGAWILGDEDAGADEDFRICDANGPRLIKLKDHHPGGMH